MKQVEKYGRTVEEALELALIEMDLEADQVTYEVLEKESKGLFGFGVREAKILVTEKVKEETVLPEVTPEITPPPVEVQAIKPTPAIQETPVATPAPAGEASRVVETYLQGILKGIGLDAIVDTVETDDMVEATIQGEGMALLIGKRGITIDALQYLTSLALNRGRDKYMHVSLDSENYRQKRKEALEVLAKRMADKAKRQRKDIMLNPMNSYERRIIHSALQKDPAVSTRSEGKDPYRKVIIFLNR